MNNLPEFDPKNTYHVSAYKCLCECGYWPKGTDYDIQERHTNPFWIKIIQSKLAEAYVDLYLNDVCAPLFKKVD